MRKDNPICVQHYVLLMLLFSILFYTPNQMLAQSSKEELSKQELYKAAVIQAQQDGTFDGFECGLNDKATIDNAKDACPSPCPQLTAGYGTNGWNPSSDGGGACANIDPACAVPPVADAACTSGKYRVPLQIVIFENPAWAGDNYLGGTGFSALPDVDITNKIAEVNSLYANANVEFYEVNRERVNNPDLYDYYRNTDPATGDNDGTSDYDQTQAYDMLDVVNLFFVGGLDNDHDCCGTMGFAPYPCSRDYSIMRYGAAVGGSTLAHELGHYFGLHHTHKGTPTTSDNTDQPSGALDNSDCLTMGDGICDTWPTPRLSHDCSSGAGGCTGVDDYCFISDVFPRCGFDAAGFNCYAVANGLPITNLTIDLNDGMNCGNGVSTILQENTMSYNFYGGCRTDFSPCQYYKIHEVLFGCRSYLCYRDVNEEFASTTINDANSPYQEICIGDAIPTFTATSACYKWYDGLGNSANELGSGATFRPTAAQIDVNTVGVYTFYLGDANEYNTDCRTPITITVLAEAGVGSGNTMASIDVGNCSSAENIALATDATQFNENGVVGWWITETNPITSSVTDDVSLATALGVTTMSSTLANPVDNLIEATSGTPKTELSLAFDCSSLDDTKTYYATPMMATSRTEIPSANCQATDGTASSITFNSQPGKFNIIPPSDVSCRPTVLTSSPTFTVCVTVSGYTGVGSNLSIIIRDDNYNGSTLVLDWQGGIGDGNGTYCYDQASMLGYDPSDPSLTTGLAVIAWEQTGSGMQNASVSTTLDITFAGVPEIPFPSVTEYNECLFGTPVMLTCACNDCSTPIVTDINENHCAGDGYFLTVGTDVYNEANPSGTTLFTSVAGCDSIINVVLTFHDVNVDISVQEPACFGEMGFLTANPTGSSPFTYDWSNNATTQTTSTTSVGVYTVSVTDANACITTASAMMTSPSEIILSLTTTDTACGLSNGNISVSASGGTPPYAYEWSDGQTTASATNLQAGTYSITVTDANNCTTSASANIFDTNGPTATTVFIDATCGNLDGSATAIVSGGISPYTYIWNTTPIQNAAMATGLGEGIYDVTVTDSNGCTSSTSVSISDSPPPVVNATATDASCGSADGSITATASSGIAPYTYIWNNGQTTATATNLSGGSYTITVTDNNGCTASASAIINELSDISLSTSSIDATCGMANGEATVTVNGGIAPYTYQWSNGQTTATATALAAGIYNVVVTDANNCTATADAIINTGFGLSLSISKLDANCGAANGEATVAVSGGTAPYTYIWNNGQTTATATSLDAGIYTVTVTDANSCTASSNTTIFCGENNTCESSLLLCNSDASFPVGTNSGTAQAGPDYGCVASQPNPIWYHFSVATAGDISILITTEPCIDIDYVLYGPFTNVDGNCDNLTTANMVDCSFAGGCNNEIFTISNGQVGEFYQLLITNFAGTAGNATMSQTGGTGALGNSSSYHDITESHCANEGYQLTVGTDVYNEANPVGTTILENAVGCDSIITVNLTFNSLNTDITVQNPDCLGETGFLTANATGASPFTYFWSNNTFSQTTSTTSVGFYTVTVTDANACTATAGATMAVANPISLAITTTDATVCGESDGAATVTASGGIAPYTYLWDNGQTTATITGLSAGTYTVTVTAADGCTMINSASIYCGTSNTCESTLFLCDPTVTFSVGTNSGTAQAGPDYGCVATQPNPIWYGFSIMSAGDISMLLEVTPCLDIDYVLYGPFETAEGNCGNLTAANIVDCSYAAGCNNESFTILNGQVGDFYHLLITNFSNNQGNVNMLQTSGTGILGNPVSIYDITENHCAGDGYELTVGTDVYNETNPIGSTILPSAEGCDSVVNVNLTFNAISFVDVIENHCAGEGYELIVGGDVYSETNPIGTTILQNVYGCDSMVTVSLIFNPADNTTITENHCAGEGYELIVGGDVYSETNPIGTTTLQNIAGCDSTITVTLIFNPAENITITENHCAGDGYELIVGTDIYNEANPAGDTTLQNVAGCDSTITVSLIFNMVDVDITVQEPACFGENGSLTANPIGNSPFTYYWSNNTITQTTSTTSVGFYGVTVTDANSCSTTASAMMTTPSPIILTTETENATCGQANGTASVTASGGILPYTYAWNTTPMQNTATAVNLSAGTYVVSITDANGCITTSSTIVDCTYICEAPNTFDLTMPSYDTALFDWNDVNMAVQYRFRIREIGTSTWTTTDVAISETANLFAHAANTNYEWQVRTDCGDNNLSAWSAVQTFTTPMPACTILNSDDFNTIIDASNGLVVTLEWAAMPSAEAYQLAGKKVGGNIKVFPETQLTSRTFTSGILYNTSYVWSVRVKCDGVWTDYALPPANFTTPPAPAKHQQNGFDIFATSESLETNVYPNPTKNEVTISVNTIAWENDINIAILDMTGRVVMQEKTTSSQTTLNVGHLNEGYYLVRTENAGAISITKLIVMK